jgi:hypothetical protein
MLCRHWLNGWRTFPDLFRVSLDFCLSSITPSIMNLMTNSFGLLYRIMPPPASPFAFSFAHAIMPSSALSPYPQLSLSCHPPRSCCCYPLSLSLLSLSKNPQALCHAVETSLHCTLKVIHNSPTSLLKMYIVVVVAPPSRTLLSCALFFLSFINIHILPSP